MFRSTTFRFAALVFLLQLASAAVLILGLGAVLRGQLGAAATRTVAVLRDDLVANYAAGGTSALARAIALRTDRPTTAGAVMLLADAHGQRIAGNLDAWPPSLAPGTQQSDVTLYRSGQGVAEPMRVVAVRLRGGARLLVGTVTTAETRALHLLEGATAVALSLALIFAAAAAWAAARLITGRLEATLGTLAGVAGGDLARRVPADASHDAFAALGRAVNAAVDRVETLVVELRVATDGLAHDLKSPLTRLRVSLERAVAAIDDPAAQEPLDRALAEADRLFAIVQTVLGITRAEAGIGREDFVSVDLGAELGAIADIYGPLVEDHGRTIAVAAPRHVHAAVHRELLGQTIGNLVDNALKYGAGPIRLSLHEEGPALRIAIVDRGPGIPSDRRADALRRFGRLDDARGGTGAGLGLTLASAVARLHNGRLELADAGPGLAVNLWISR